MLKQSSIPATMLYNQPNHHNQPSSDNINHLQTNNRDLSSVNLFHLQAQHPENDVPSIIRQKSRSKSFRRVLKKKTPSEILKQGILRSRQMQRVNSLRSITSQNLKLFLRLQDQKSSYKFEQLHRELSCSILPLAKSNATGITKEAEKDRSNFRVTVRCSSANSTLKSKCASLRSIARSNNSTSRGPLCQEVSHNNITMITASRATSKLSIFTDKCDKENMASNKPPMSQSKEEAIIMKKIGVKIPIDKPKLKNLGQKITNRQFSSKLQTVNTKIAQPFGILTERKLLTNVLN